MPAADPLSVTFAALADPTRRAILARLAQGEATVSELAQPFAMSLPGVSKHLRVLRDAGLIVQGREAQWRPCRLDPARLAQVDQWLAEYRELWEDRFQRLEAFLSQAEGGNPTHASDAMKAQTPRTARSPRTGKGKEVSR
jgi:DNA-binding transcriptional ArsR family regulator